MLSSIEDPSGYDSLLAELARDLRPRDFTEWLWVKDIADHTWDIIRYRRIKAAYIDGRIQTALVNQHGLTIDAALTLRLMSLR